MAKFYRIMSVTDFLPQSYSSQIETGEVTWRSPSNIALVKYWGKYGEQLPQNPSISFTLDNCHTTTTLKFQKVQAQEIIAFEIYLDGVAVPDFKPKIATFFERVVAYLPFIKEYSFRIETSNSFPHSSGIASSASGMSALSLCLMSIEKILQPEMTADFFNKKASFLSRLGSGSACRSIEGPLVVWGENKSVSDASQIYGVTYKEEVHSVFKNYQDTILLVDKGEKQVSSTVGHGLMHGHAFAKARFEQAHENLEALTNAMRQGDQETFIKLVESEALTLHAMMMTSHPYFILMKPKTLEVIQDIWEYREQSGSKICFTLDAGANVHVLYPKSEKESVQKFIGDRLARYCQNGQFIHDQAGLGAQQIS